ncbi:hypothetical protein WMY93_020406 [Mugilogobius chulae]|uniref:Uncharacterized protein n=1 Tax=Mugilogobius chulae TaxID=88201 RepID=A0AAW0NJT9_9GOBI
MNSPLLLSSPPCVLFVCLLIAVATGSFRKAQDQRLFDPGTRLQLWHQQRGARRGIRGTASHRAHSAPAPVDFMALNRDAVKSGLNTAKELSQYRAQRPLRLQPIKGKQQRAQPTTGQGRQGLVSDMTHGLSGRARPDEPIDLLLAHEYSQRWIQEQLKRNKDESLKVKKRSISETRTSLLRKTLSLPQTQTQVLPRTNRYIQVGPALDTFRDPESRTRALKAHREAPSIKAQS